MSFVTFASCLRYQLAVGGYYERRGRNETDRNKGTQSRPKSITERGPAHQFTLLRRRFQCHLLRNPKADTTSDESKPNHQVVLDRDILKGRHGLAEETRVDEEGGNASDRMILFWLAK